MTLALFDLDHTLLQADSDHGWGDFLVNKGLVDAEQYTAANQHFYRQYQAGTLDIHEYAAFSFQFLQRTDRATLNALHQQYMEEFVRPRISQAARELVARHREQGHTLIIITATNSFVTRPIATELGISELIAIEPRMENGHFTTQIAGIPSFREGKVQRLYLWLENNTETLAGSYFYSDSHNDLPLLELVDHPIAVDPDNTLRAIAEERHWPVISLLP